MTNLALQLPPSEQLAGRLSSRGDLTGFLMELTEEIGADNYMLVAILHDQGRSDVRIIASNWIYDAIQLAGHPLIAVLAQGTLTTVPGARPRALVTARAPAGAPLTGEDARLLAVLGHCEIYSLQLNIGRQRLFVLFSAEQTGRIDVEVLMQAQLRCCYALSQVPALLAEASMQDPLSDRERECLFWVSEGKTTDDVAVILGVSANTVNSYITQAIRKLAASNRAMAVATAIRSGMI